MLWSVLRARVAATEFGLGKCMAVVAILGLPELGIRALRG